MQLNFTGILVGLFSFFTIGVFHPIVIKSEYYFTARIWPVFLLIGLALLIAALLTTGLLSIALGILGMDCLWCIIELHQQAERVQKGWFPKNPKR